MSYSESLAERIREVLKKEAGITERKMFGGLAFLLNENMCCGVLGKTLIVRVGREQDLNLLKKPNTKPMDFTGKPMRGLLYVSPAGTSNVRNLKFWVNKGLSYCKSLPKKQAKSKAD